MIQTPSQIQYALDNPRSPESRALAEATLVIVDKASRFALRPLAALLSRNPGELVADFCQAIMCRLYEGDGAMLRAWDPKRASYEAYLRMISRRWIYRRMRGFRGNPWSLELLPGDELDGGACRLVASSVSAEMAVWLRQVDRFIRTLPPTDRRRYVLLFVEQRTVAEVAKQERTTAEAIHTWTHRFRHKLKSYAADVSAPKRQRPDASRSSSSGRRVSAPERAEWSSSGTTLSRASEENQDPEDSGAWTH